MTDMFDVLVVGGGHAGCEAAAAASRMGARVALVTMSPRTVGAMSCNPAIGGLGKGHLVREIDALDGLMGRAADHAGIQYRMLNRSKGKAVQGPRVQADRKRYAAAIRRLLRSQGVRVIAGEAASLSVKSGRVCGLELSDGTCLTASNIVLATGTFLDARMFRGEAIVAGGRQGEPASVRMAEQLRELCLPMGRLKTGTPPRLDGRTIRWDALPRQESDFEPWTMSALMRRRSAPQIFCAITRTSSATHDIIRSALHRSPLHGGAISGRGPRYCPSIEDKVARFGDRDGHQVFLEPEGLDSPLVYPNGISTSLPLDKQQSLVRSIAGLDRAEIVRPGYAVEYEFVDPRALDRRLGLRAIEGLSLAGQINGTTGYEEAAAQGLVAGLNAAARVLGRNSAIFERESSYLGVMIDDLTLQGVSEPYRMLTARAEYRLRLRADNAGTRLHAIGRDLGCLGRRRLAKHAADSSKRTALEARLSERWSAKDLIAAELAVDPTAKTRSLSEWIADPKVADAVARLLPATLQGPVADEVIEDARYAPYLARQDNEISSLRADRAIVLPPDMRYDMIAGLSAEMVEKFGVARPSTLEEASRVPGVTPAAMTAILVASKRKAA